MIVTAAYPRRRALAVKNGAAVDGARAQLDDARANAMLAAQIRKAGREPIAIEGEDPGSAHREPSFWVWDATEERTVRAPIQLSARFS